MTCIIGLVDKDKLWMAGDSAASEGERGTFNIINPPKVFRLNNMLIGYTSSFRMGQLLQYGFATPKHPRGMSTEKYLTTFFVDAVRDRFKSGGFSYVENSKETGGEFLIAYRDGLFKMQPDFSVLSCQRGFDACGCGEDIACGAMYALADLSPKARLLRSLEIVEKVSAYVKSPFLVKHMKIRND